MLSGPICKVCSTYGKDNPEVKYVAVEGSSSEGVVLTGDYLCDQHHILANKVAVLMDQSEVQLYTFIVNGEEHFRHGTLKACLGLIEQWGDGHYEIIPYKGIR